MDFLCSIFPRGPCLKFFAAWPGVQRNWYDYKSILRATSHSPSQRTITLCGVFGEFVNFSKKCKKRSRKGIFSFGASRNTLFVFCSTPPGEKCTIRSSIPWQVLCCLLCKPDAESISREEVVSNVFAHAKSDSPTRKIAAASNLLIFHLFCVQNLLVLYSFPPDVICIHSFSTLFETPQRQTSIEIWYQQALLLVKIFFVYWSGCPEIKDLRFDVNPLYCLRSLWQKCQKCISTFLRNMIISTRSSNAFSHQTLPNVPALQEVRYIRKF